MNALLAIAAPLASLDRTSRLDAMRKGFGEQSSDHTQVIVVLLSVGALLTITLIVALVVQRSRARCQRRAKYLRHAIRLLALNSAQARDVYVIANRAGLPRPTAMLLSPANLAHAVHHALLRKDNPRLRERLNRLSMSLFGCELPDVPDQDAAQA